MLQTQDVRDSTITDEIRNEGLSDLFKTGSGGSTKVTNPQIGVKGKDLNSNNEKKE